MAENVTIYSIAKETGVAPSTVSRVLNDNPHVSKETRSKVLKALEAAGYVPNDTARNLVTKSSRMIGILITDIRETLQSNTLHTIEREFMKKGYSCLIYNTGLDPEDQKTYTKLLSQKMVDGVIIIGSNYQSDGMKAALKTYFSKVPVIVINGKLEGDNVCSIYCDVRSGITQCTEYLKSLGRSNIGFVYAAENPGIVKATEAIRSKTETFAVMTARRPEEVVESIRILLQEHPDVDGLVFADDYLAIAGMRGLFDFGKSIPKDISVIGIGNSRYTRISNPRLTSLDTMLFDCALTAVRTLLSAIEGEHIPSSMQLSPKLIVREST